MIESVGIGGFFGTANRLKKNKLKKLYSPLNLKPTVLETVVKAHEYVVRKGIETQHEHCVTICGQSGEAYPPRTDGQPNEVGWFLPPDRKGYIGVHNHPNNTPFSVRDLQAFMLAKDAKCLAAQAHSGVVYILWREKPDTREMSLVELHNIKDRIREHPKMETKCEYEKSEIFANYIANYMGWKIEKGEVRNEQCNDD
ncbi:MAG: hypothetical protein FWG87_11980 [Defluviitaleaceae bacterium]|nr:hypothetical protein [Defluviitaleaceae bacterium]